MVQKLRTNDFSKEKKNNKVMVLFLYFCVYDLQCTRSITLGRAKLTCSEADKSALDRVGTTRSLIGREERISFSGAVTIVKH